ncbi:MAG: hypothetical protein LQ341_002279 [Variospora aurantia]|nr:MAG: hypothetical protein LQ341_002279 [Variospora aurantia]
MAPPPAPQSAYYQPIGQQPGQPYHGQPLTPNVRNVQPTGQPRLQPQPAPAQSAPRQLSSYQSIAPRPNPIPAYFHPLPPSSGPRAAPSRSMEAPWPVDVTPVPLRSIAPRPPAIPAYFWPCPPEVPARPRPSRPLRPKVRTSLPNPRRGNAQIPAGPVAGIGFDPSSSFDGSPGVNAPSSSNRPDVPADDLGIPEVDHELQGISSMDELIDQGRGRAEFIFTAASRVQNDWMRSHEHSEAFGRFWNRAVPRRNQIQRLRDERAAREMNAPR